MDKFVRPGDGVRQIRTALEWTQREMAERLGVSEITVRTIESGRLKMSRNFGLRLFHETGWGGALAPTVILSPKVKTLPYSKQAYNEWKASWAKSTKRERQALARSVYEWAGVLFEAAANPENQSDLFPAVYQAVTEALTEIAREFRLGAKADVVANTKWPGARWTPSLVPPGGKNFGPMNISELLGILSLVKTEASATSKRGRPMPQRSVNAGFCR